MPCYLLDAVLALLGWDEWTVWSVCNENNEQHRKRRCRTSNPGPHICQGPSKETRMCIPEMSNGKKRRVVTC